MHVGPVPKVSIFMAVTTKKVTEKAQKWAKMARFWPKMRWNGRVMARDIFFHQCLWVTKFCAKFGRSRIPRTARVHNSFVILRCMWKEPAPLSNRHERKIKLFYPKAIFLPTVKISAEFCWIQNVLYACTRMSGLRLRKPELPNFQGCQTVFEINVKRKRDFNVFLQIHVSIF